MSDKRKYDLLGLDNKCLLTGININMSSPDLTSIIDAFENKRNPAELFSKDDDKSKTILYDGVNSVCDYLDVIKLWLDRNVLPSLQLMIKSDIKKFTSALTTLDNKLFMLSSQVRKIKKTHVGNKKRVVRLQYCHEAVCPACDSHYYCGNTNDWEKYERHCHVAEILSTGITNIPTEIPTEPEEYTIIEIDPDIPDKCIAISAPCVAKENTTENNSDRKAAKFVNNSLPLCLYNAQIRNVLYPLEICSSICSIEENYEFYTVQAVTPQKYSCLLCKSDLIQEKSVYSHINGNKHRNKLKMRDLTSKVKEYHEIFSNVPYEVQLHQTVFKPSHKPDFMYCKVCALQIHGKKVIQHINTYIHRIRLNTKRFEKYNFINEMLRTVGLEPSNSDDESSEMSIQSQLIYNSDSKVSALITGIDNISLNDSPKGSESGDEITDEDSGTPEDNEIIELAKEPLQGTSKMKPENHVPHPKNNFQTNGNLETVKTPKNETKPPPKHNIVLAFKEHQDDLLDEIENRYQVHLEYIKVVNSNLQCTLCMKTIPYTVGDIRNHVASNDHKKNAEIHCGKQKFTYYCDLCYKFIRNEAKWDEHLLCIEHKQRVDGIHKNREPRGGYFKEYECTICNLVFYGNNSMINKHIRENFGCPKKVKKPKEIKLPIQILSLLRNEQLLAEEIFKLNKESKEVLSQINLSWQCCQGIEKALEPIFGPCRAYPFGSRVSGLGNLVSDLDVFVDTGSMYFGNINQDSDSQARIVNDVSKILKKHKDFIDVFAIPNARTPIVQVFHRVTGLDCDLSFRHGLSVENTEFLKLCIGVQPKLKTLILFLKRWLKSCHLADKITTYALAMLVIFYFQQRNLLPSLKTIREVDPTECKVIAGWQTFSYTQTLPELNKWYPPTNLLTRDLLTEFFEFYKKFKFNLVVVCPLLGHTVLKADFYTDKGKRLPLEMAAYVTKINESDQNEVFRSMSPMCVQDPFDLSHNLTKACPVDVVNKFVTLCELSHAVLNSSRPSTFTDPSKKFSLEA